MLNKLTVFLLSLALLSGCQSVGKNNLDTKEQNNSKAIQPKTLTVEKIDPALRLFQLALESAKAGETKIALEQFQQLSTQYPTQPKAHTNSALLLLKLEQYKAAEESLILAIKQDKNDAIAYNHLAIIQRQQGLFDQAKENYLMAIKINPEYANAQLNLAILLDIYLQELATALTHYLNYQQLNSDDPLIEKWIIDLKTRIKAAS